MFRAPRPLLLLLSLTAILTLIAACKPSEPVRNDVAPEPEQSAAASAQASTTGTRASLPDLESRGLARATFAGGCFWCMEPPFDATEGVVSTTSGYTGGPESAPTYEDVSSGRTGHTEAIEVIYDPDLVSYDELLDVFWRSHDPTDAAGQFADRGSQYRPAIFYHSELQLEQARASKANLQADGPFQKPIVTAIEPAQTFWIAEDYHQDYYQKNPDPYQRYYRASGRQDFLKRIWSDR
ncbi:peptide-methionine (S)-S-oxide reductase [Lujinxingia litoralis]|uniref:Peptide methionine sulfoxide reductase MsrA n=1 Tax=Lujinxingia litoralis TaxID=2211119 RepID=A0A328C3Y1_9DELT|nr:peptide-methionine (S)-S-oxide reductase MsrA [Lujinxingia litoralis]RAL20447.1 peptide-methionine (S)-S-oxide reductase [Lujinxingia litoralis]